MIEDIVARAACYAAAAHKGQRRKYDDEPYINHPARIVAAVAENARLFPNIPGAMAAAWLHDTVEDCGVSLDALESNFNSYIRMIVGFLTNPSKQHPELPRAERKEMDRKQLAEAPKSVKIIKMFDRIDNIHGLVNEPSFARLYLDESEALADALKDADQGIHGKLVETIKNVRGKLGVS